MPKRIYSKPLNIILLGDPTSGKGTQARMLTRKFNMRHFSSGVVLRRMAAQHTPDGRRLTAYFKIGRLIPYRYVLGIMRQVIIKTPASKGILFDGNPRRVAEAIHYPGWLAKAGRSNPVVFYLTVPETEMYKRTVAREVAVNGKKQKRDEDNLQALQRRSVWSKADVGQSYKFLKTKYSAKKISGMGTRNQVHQRILKEIEAYEKHENRVHKNS